MKYFLTLISFVLTLALLACAPVQNTSTAPTEAQSQNQPHLPPPPFTEASESDVRYCGGMRGGAGQTCGADEYCHRDIPDICGAADAPGRCRTIPEICTMDYNPVCGCDGKTYSNECTANAKGISAASKGECE